MTSEVLGKTTVDLEEKLDLTLSDFDKIVEDTYLLIFDSKALRLAESNQDDRKRQLLLRLRDFATIVEAKRSMSAGDIGRLIMIWKKWSVMIQGLKGLVHYSTHLPRLVLLLTHSLPKPLARIIAHSMLISPSGRRDHFVAKDFFLEIQNYWLKFFYNHSVGQNFKLQSEGSYSMLIISISLQGTGTEISRLKDIISINVPFVSISINIT